MKYRLHKCNFCSAGTLDKSIIVYILLENVRSFDLNWSNKMKQRITMMCKQKTFSFFSTNDDDISMCQLPDSNVLR